VIEKQPLLNRKDAFILLDLSLDIAIVSRLTTWSLMNILPVQFLTEIYLMKTTFKKKHFKPICARAQIQQQNQEGKWKNKPVFPNFVR